MQTLLQNDLVSAVRGTGEEARLGGQGSGDGWAEGWKGGGRLKGYKGGRRQLRCGLVVEWCWREKWEAPGARKI